MLWPGLAIVHILLKGALGPVHSRPSVAPYLVYMAPTCLGILCVLLVCLIRIQGMTG